MSGSRNRRLRVLAGSVGLVVAMAGCGSSAGKTSTAKPGAPPATGVTQTTSSTATPVKAVVLAPSEHPVVAEFPPAHHRTLKELGALAGATAQLGAATGVLTPGTDRFAFGLTAATSGAYLYGPTALYIATSPGSRAQGPFLAPADPMGVAPSYRSEENAGPFGIQAIYETSMRLPRVGTYTILALTHIGRQLIASPGELAVAPSPIPDVGQRPPAIGTETLASVGGKVALLTTRIPPESMHSVSFSQVLGKRPIALLFSTPELCTSRVCGPVTDLLVQAQHEFGSRITFIHQEIFVDNEPTKGLRSQLKAFHLETEPWLFTINRHGVIAARLQGAFGAIALRKAIEAALA